MARIFALLMLLLAGCGSVENSRQTLNMEVRGEVLALNGIINTRALGDFRELMAENPHIRMVQLEDLQGSLDDISVVDMGYEIRDRGLATRMISTSKVYSGGVDLFLAGVDRQITPGAEVGVHEWESNLGRARDYPRNHRQHEPTRSYIEDMLGSDAFYWFTLEAAPFDSVHLMSRAELLRYGVVTR